MSWDAIKDILETKTVRRNLSLKIFEYGKLEDASGMRKRIVIKLKKGLNQELAKEISKLIRDNSKAIPQIQGETVRVTSKSKDELQGIMQLLKGKDFPAALQFTNYRQ
jgi:uncharacterized protein YajQ (UPF0234 family)